MLQLFQLAGYVLLAWLAVLALVIAFRILRGEISLTGLLATEGTRFDPERIQSLLVTLFVVGIFITEAMSTRRHAFPDIPQGLLVLLAGSNGLYLSGKMVRLSAMEQRSRRPRAHHKQTTKASSHRKRGRK